MVFIKNVYTSDGNVYLSDTWLEQASRARAGSYTRRDVCREGSWEGDFYGNVHPQSGDPVIVKHRFSAFHNTELDTVLRSHAIRTLVMTGVASNVCVDTTARGLRPRLLHRVFVRWHSLLRRRRPSGNAAQHQPVLWPDRSRRRDCVDLAGARAERS